MAASAGEVELSVVPEASAFGGLLLGQIGKQLGPLEAGVSKLINGVLGNALGVGGGQPLQPVLGAAPHEPGGLGHRAALAGDREQAGRPRVPGRTEEGTER